MMLLPIEERFERLSMAGRRLEFVRFLMYVTVPLTAFWWSNSPKNTAALRDFVRFRNTFCFDRV